MVIDWKETWGLLDKDVTHIGCLVRLLEKHAQTPQQRALLSIVREITEEKGAISLEYILEKIELAFGRSVVVKPRDYVEVSH